jgi:hypothetical protein
MSIIKLNLLFNLAKLTSIKLAFRLICAERGAGSPAHPRDLARAGRCEIRGASLLS